MNRLEKIATLSLVLTLTTVMFVSPDITKAADGGFTLKSNKTTLQNGDSLEVSITLNTSENAVTSYIANLSYPEDKLTFEAADTQKSPFTMILESKGGNGEVNIINGSTTPLTGDLYVGKVTFKAKNATSSEAVTVSNKSAILTANNINILPGSLVQKDEDPSTVKKTNIESLSDKQTSIFPGLISTLFSKITNFFTSLFN